MGDRAQQKSASAASDAKLGETADTFCSIQGLKGEGGAVCVCVCGGSPWSPGIFAVEPGA